MRIKKGSIQILLGVLLILSGFLLTGYNIWEGNEAAQASQEAVVLLDEIVVAEQEENALQQPTEVLMPDYVLDPEMEMPTRAIDGWDYVGILEIPDLNLSLPIINEWSYVRCVVLNVYADICQWAVVERCKGIECLSAEFCGSVATE